MAPATSWGLGVVVCGVALLLVATLESTSWEVTVERPLLHMSTTTNPQTLCPTHCMDQCTRGMFMLHTTTCNSTRTSMLLY